MIGILSDVELFRTIPGESLAVLSAHGARRAFRASSHLMRQGDVGHSLHIVVKGRVRLERWHAALVAPVVLEELGPGEIVGELGVLDGRPLADTVTAIEDTETIELSEAALTEVVLQFPASSTTLLAALSRCVRSPADLAERMAREGRDADAAADWAPLPSVPDDGAARWRGSRP